MGLLDSLWDDTMAGPMPDTGLGKLRKYDSSPVSGLGSVPVTRSITILKPNSNFSADSGSGSIPSSPAGSSGPSSPFSFSPRTPRSDMKGLSRRKSLNEAFERAEPRSPTVYDWVVISAMDR